LSDAKKILLLEDDPNLGAVIEEHLKLNGYAVRRCHDGVEGSEAFGAEHFDLCLVDIMMPKKDGFTFVREVRAFNTQIPIIFLTAKSLQEDRIEGFKIGCDDYITKPFSIEELELRIQVALRRTASADETDSSQKEFNIGSYSFNSDRRMLLNSNSERKLTPKEAELLRLLCVHMNKTLSRETALREIWGDDSYFSGRSMDVFVSKLRKYLQDDTTVELMSVHGKGLRLLVS
jgi:DNA-binding response OmpR family regulator